MEIPRSLLAELGAGGSARCAADDLPPLPSLPTIPCDRRRFCTRMHAAWDQVDSRLAWLFGLDQSKYQWAIDQHVAQQKQVRTWPAGVLNACAWDFSGHEILAGMC